MNRETGGAAFPGKRERNGQEIAFSNDKRVEVFTSGMTLRDYLAGKVLQGLAANPGGPWQADSVMGWSMANCTLADVVEVAYQTADAALVERAK